MTQSLGGLAGMTFAAVIFDMDGTLIDSTPAVERAWSTWAVEHGVSLDPAAHHGMPAAQTVARLVAAEELAAEHRESAVARINELELTDVEGIELLPGTAEALAALAGGPAAIATSCTRALATVRIEVAGLTVPSVLVTADDIERGKPAPDPFLEAAARLGVSPTDCLVVEDAPAGLIAARAAGCRTLAVATTHSRAELDADAVIGTLGDVAFLRTGDRVGLRLAD